MSHIISLIIPHIEKNNFLLFQNIPYILKNIECKYIYIITPKTNFIHLTHLKSEKIKILNEDSIYTNLTFSIIKSNLEKLHFDSQRTGWYFQQFIKMAWAYNELCEDWYVVWDSDTFPLQKAHFFTQSGKPYFLKKHEHNEAYFETLKSLLGYDKQVDFSFIAENMIINKNMMQNLVNSIEDINKKPFYEEILQVALKSSRPTVGFSEFETYGNYIMKNYPDMYDIKESTGFRNGTKYFGLHPNKYDLHYLENKFPIASFERWNTIFLPFIFLNKCIAKCYYFFKH